MNSALILLATLCFAQSIAASSYLAPSKCSVPCPVGIIREPVCGVRDGFDYHTFTNNCARKCHAEKNPSRVYELTGQPGLTCGEQFLQEEFLPLDQPSEFDFPYIRVSGHQPPHIPADIPHFDECSVPCPIGFAPQPVCGQHGVNGYSAEYHTFSNNCARKCHAKKNPSHAFQIIGDVGRSCNDQGFAEQFVPHDEPTEFDFPYNRKTLEHYHAPSDVIAFDECSVPCPTGIIRQPVCGLKGGYTLEYHTFNSDCDRKCHAKKNPSRAFEPVGLPGHSCSDQGYGHEHVPFGNQPSEFDFPYNAY